MLTTSAMSNDHGFLPYQLLEQITKEQHESQIRAWGALGPTAPAWSMCDTARQDIGLFFAGLREIGLWPLNTVSIADLKARLTDMPLTKSPKQPCTIYKCSCKDDTLDALRMKVYVEKVYDSVRGVCLDCVKRKQLGVNGSSCRVNCYGKSLTYM